MDDTEIKRDDINRKLYRSTYYALCTNIQQLHTV